MIIVVGIIFLIFGLILFYVDCTKEKSQIISFYGGLVTATGMMIICASSSETELSEIKPTTLDVYNNKTTLQITYVDSISTDTVVVFKE